MSEISIKNQPEMLFFEVSVCSEGIYQWAVAFCAKGNGVLEWENKKIFVCQDSDKSFLEKSFLE